MADGYGMRVSDADRERVVTVLREHVEQGRLTLEEFQGRLDETYQAKTVGELALVTRDLPAGVPPAPPSAAPVRRQRGGAGRVLFRVWLMLCLLNVVIWALASVTNMELIYFWPMWLIVPGAAMWLIAVWTRPRDT